MRASMGDFPAQMPCSTRGSAGQQPAVAIRTSTALQSPSWVWNPFRICGIVI